MNGLSLFLKKKKSISFNKYLAPDGPQSPVTVNLFGDSVLLKKIYMLLLLLFFF